MAENNMIVVREALKLCGARMCRLCKELELARSMLNKRPLGVFCHSDKCTAYQAAHAALALPPRNCDVGTPDEQSECFKNFCRNHQSISVDSEDGFPPVYVCSNESCPLHGYYIVHGEDNCELAWAQMLYEGKEGGNDAD